MTEVNQHGENDWLSCHGWSVDERPCKSFNGILSYHTRCLHPLDLNRTSNKLLPWVNLLNQLNRNINCWHHLWLVPPTSTNKWPTLVHKGWPIILAIVRAERLRHPRISRVQQKIFERDMNEHCIASQCCILLHRELQKSHTDPHCTCKFSDQHLVHTCTCHACNAMHAMHAMQIFLNWREICLVSPIRSLVSCEFLLDQPRPKHSAVSLRCQLSKSGHVT